MDEQLNLRQLEMFLVVSEELHFGRASARLYLAQPSLSQAIKRLEHSLGVKLFERTTRQVALTDAGRVFAERVPRVLADLQEAATIARDAEAGRAGTLRLGFPTLNPDDFLPRLAAVHRERYPGVRIEPELMSSHDQLIHISDGTLDAGLLWLGLGDTDAASELVHCTTISTHELVVAAPASHRLSRAAHVALGDLRHLPVVSFHNRARSILNEAAVTACKTAGFVPNIVQDVPDVRTLLALIGAGVGFGILPDAVRYWGVPGVEVLDLNDDLPSIRFSFARRITNEGALLNELAASVRSLAQAS